MTPESLSQILSDFLLGARAAVVVEDGAIAFDLAESKYSISGEPHKCLLHLWSNERNFVRRVLDAEVKATTLRLQVQRMGQTRSTRLDFCRDRDQRSPAARRMARVANEPRLRRALEKTFPNWTVVRLTAPIWNTPLVRRTCVGGCNKGYAQVPAFAAADRAMIDILAETREARLAVIELKADEDIHLPLQGVDYWSRVAWHQSRGELTKFGYFPGHELSRQNRC